MAEKHRKTRVLFPIGAKLVIIISIILLVSLGAVTILVSVISTGDVQRTAEDNNFTVNRRAGSQAESSFRSVESSCLLFLEMIDRSEKDAVEELGSYFFGRNQSIASMAVLANQSLLHIPNDQFLLEHAIDSGAAEAYFNTKLVSGQTGSGMKLFNASPDFKTPLLLMVFTRSKAAVPGDMVDEATGTVDTLPGETVGVLFSPDDLAESLGTGTNSSFMINDEGEVLIYSDIDLVLGGANFSNTPLVLAMEDMGDNNRQISYTDTDGQKYFGAYYRLPQAGAVVLTTVAHSIVFEAVQSITKQNIYLTIGVLCVAILLIWLFSKTISTPVRSLADAALRIEQGEFEVDLKPRTHDELGLLTESFGKMSSALSIFGRFTNKDIAVRAMRGEIKPGGLPKHATIFFSDIRGFTEKSETFTKAFGEDASNRIVMWLNEYFTRMVDCVEKTGGVVDKYIGDAVMAHWGTAFTAGSPAEDAFNCVKASLLMRKALMEINAARPKGDPGNPEIRIGCGINTGIITAGQIGSEQRMEYTVIGDPVNLASRTEGLNKPLGTDILITEDTWNLTGDKLIVEEMPPVTVKGKAKPVRMFAVVNLKGAEGPKTLADVRKLLGIPAPDLSKVDTDAEEKKYKIKGN